MKKIFLKTLLIALLSAVGVSQAWAGWQNVTFVSSNGNGTSDSEVPAKLCDGDPSIKWCSNGGMVGKYVIFSTSSAITLKAYRLTHGDDTKQYTERGWRSWSLYGSTSSDPTGSWTLLDEIVDNAIISEQQEIRYLPSNSQSFQYYKIVVNKLQSGNLGQMAEIEVTADNLSTDITIRPGYVSGNETSAYDNVDYFSKLVDVDSTATLVGSKWCCKNFSSPNTDGAMHLVVDARYPIKLTSHSFWSGDDTEQYPGRRLMAWKLYGSNNTTMWNLLFTSGSEEHTSAKNNTQTNHPVSGVSVAYRYYKFVPTASGDNGSRIQLMDFKLTGTLDTPLEVVFNSNQGSGSMPSQIIWSSDSLRANTFAGPSGKTVFLGWNTNPDGSGTAYANKALIEKSSITSSSMTLYAQWGSTCTVTYDANGGSGSMDSHTITTEDGTLKMNTFTAPSADHVFVGWNTQANGSGVSYTDGARIITTTSPSSLNLYAQWINKTQVESLLKPVEIDVNSFNGNCVIGKTETPSSVYASGKPDMYLDKSGAFFSKETDFTKFDRTSIYFSATYGMQASDNINDGNGIMIPFHYAWTGTGAFDGLDALHLTAANESHTLMLKTPVALEKLYFCGTAGNLKANQTTITVTINFTDNSSVSRTFDMQDWFQKSKSSNGRYGYARYATGENTLYTDGTDGAYGPAVYCLSMNNAVDAKKYIKSITFKQGDTQMKTAIFAITGQKCASAPKEPQNRVCHMTKETTVISFDSVSLNKVDQAISGVTYEYLISSKSDFSDTIKLADLNFIKQGNRIIGTIDQNYSGYYIRVRAENNSGYSDFVDVPYKHKVTILPYSNGTVTGISADSTYAAGAEVSLTAAANSGYMFKHWVKEETEITENPLKFNISYDVTIEAVFMELSVSDGTDMTYTAAQNEVNTKLAAWATKGTQMNVTVKRTIYKDGCYNTICLPFDLTNAQIVEAFGEYTALKQFVSATVQGEESNRSLVIELEEVTTIAAGKPYLISFASGANLPQVTFKDVTVTATEPETVGEGDVTFNGILTPVILQYENHNLLFVGGNNKLYWPLSDGKFTRGFRAYFEVSTSSPVIARGMKAVFGEKTTPTGNTNIKATANEIKKLVEAGRVVILCDGVKYDLNGNILK